METTNLWGDLAGITGFRTPSAILKEQADILGRITGGYVTAVVTQSGDDGTVAVQLCLQAHKLDNYSQNVLTVRHPIKGYPLKIHDNLRGTNFTAANELEFNSVLAGVLSSKDMRELIAALMSYGGKTKIESTHEKVTAA